MAQVQKGQDVLIYVNTGTEASPTWETIGGQRGADIARTAATIDASSKDSADAQLIAGRKESSVSIDALFIPTNQAYQKLLSAYDSQTNVLVRKSNLGNFVEEAECFITDLSESHPDNDVATVSIELLVNGGWKPAAGSAA